MRRPKKHDHETVITNPVTFRTYMQYVDGPHEDICRFARQKFCAWFRDNRLKLYTPDLIIVAVIPPDLVPESPIRQHISTDAFINPIEPFYREPYAKTIRNSLRDALPTLTAALNDPYDAKVLKQLQATIDKINNMWPEPADSREALDQMMRAI